MIFTLKELKLSDKELKVNIPTKGETVTHNQFMKIVEDMQKKMKMNMKNLIKKNMKIRYSILMTKNNNLNILKCLKNMI